MPRSLSLNMYKLLPWIMAIYYIDTRERENNYILPNMYSFFNQFQRFVNFNCFKTHCMYNIVLYSSIDKNPKYECWRKASECRVYRAPPLWAPPLTAPLLLNTGRGFLSTTTWSGLVNTDHETELRGMVWHGIAWFGIVCFCRCLCNNIIGSIVHFYDFWIQKYIWIQEKYIIASIWDHVHIVTFIFDNEITPK